MTRTLIAEEGGGNEKGKRGSRKARDALVVLLIDKKSKHEHSNVSCKYTSRTWDGPGNRITVYEEKQIAVKPQEEPIDRAVPPQSKTSRSLYLVNPRLDFARPFIFDKAERR
jgi:hypothetical protein